MLKRKKMKRTGLTGDGDVDITSLLDILVILLVFLLRSYNESEFTVDLMNNLTLPDSQSEQAGATAPLVLLNTKNALRVNSHKLGYINKKETINSKLVEKLKELNPKGELKKINLAIDEKVRFENIQVLLRSVAEAKFFEYKLIVQKNE